MSYNRNKYKIVLFKNGERSKVFFSSNSKKSILNKYNKLIGEKKPKFITEYISRKKVMFELSIITTETAKESIFVKDELGRNKKITLGESSYNIIKLLPYWKEEMIYNHTTKSKISFSDLVDSYLSSKDFKQVFTLNNKFIIQKDEVFNVFSLKTIAESFNFQRLRNHFLCSSSFWEKCLILPWGQFWERLWHKHKWLQITAHVPKCMMMKNS